MRVAIVKLSSLGDVIHAIPVAAALRRHLPNAHLTWVAEAREAALLTGHPALDAVLAVDTRRWRRWFWTPGGARQIRATMARLRAARFDIALDLQGLIKSGLLVACTRAPLRVGFATGQLRERWSALFTNCRVAPPPEAVHVVDQYLALLTPLGVADRRPVFTLPVPEGPEQRMEAFLAEHGVKPGDRLAALTPGARRRAKRWPVAHWRRLAERLSLESGIKLLLLWGPGEQALAAAVGRDLPTGCLLAPPTTLHELAALVRRAALVIGADTGPLHLAAAVGTPCLGLYGPTSAARNGPYGPHCESLESPNGEMASLEVDAVFAAATELLARSSAAAPSTSRPVRADSAGIRGAGRPEVESER